MPLTANPASWADLVDLPFRDGGRDWSGVDCWGLGVLAYRHLLGIELPSYADRYTGLDTATRADLARLIEAEAVAWTRVPMNEVRAFDAVNMRVAGVESHIGFVVEPGRMLHIHAGGYSEIVRYLSAAWLPRIEGFYRHAELL